MATTNPALQGGEGLGAMPTAPVSSSPFTHPVDGPAPSGPMQGPVVQRPAPTPTPAPTAARGPSGGSAGSQATLTPSPRSTGPVVKGNLSAFAHDVLTRIGAPATPNNVQFIMAWANREGGGGANNPLNTTQPYNNAGDFNPVGVKNYANITDGAAATAQTILNGMYGDIIGDLRAGTASVSKTYSGLHTWSGENGYSSLAGVSSSDRALSGGGGGGAAGSGAPVNDPTFNEKSFQAAVASSGFSSAMLHSDKSLMDAYRAAVKNKYSPEEWKAAVEATSWFRSRSNSAQRYDQLSFQDPGTFNRQIAVQRQALLAQAGTMGVSMTPARLDALSRSSLRMGMSADEIRKSLAAEAKYNPNAAAGGGQVGQVVDQIKQKASEYFADTSPATIQSLLHTVMSKQTADGQPDLRMVDDYFKGIATSKFPWLKQQLDQGFTIAQLADPYKQEIGKTLEVDPQSIKNNDPTLLRGLQYQDPANTKAGFTTQPLYSFQDMLRKDPRWMQTDNARSSLIDQGTSVLKDFGLMT